MAVILHLSCTSPMALSLLLVLVSKTYPLLQVSQCQNSVMCPCACKSKPEWVLCRMYLSACAAMALRLLCIHADDPACHNSGRQLHILRRMISFGKCLFLMTLFCRCRVDIVYELNSGQVYILAYVLDPTESLDMVVSTDAGSALDVNGNPSRPASYFLRYQPRPAAVDRGGLAMNTILGSTLAASVAMSSLASLSHPYMPAGEHLLPCCF